MSGRKGRSGRPANQQRRRVVCELRRRGWTFRRIADHIGVTRQEAEYLYRAALADPPDGAPALVAGPYRTPRLRVGDRASCLYRDAEVVVTGWSDAPTPWPRCRALGRRGGSGLLVTDELVRAIRTESSVALQHWFGVSEATVWAWRKSFGVGQWGTEGSRRLHQLNSRAGAEAVKGKEWTEAERAAKRRLSSRLGLARHLEGRRWAGKGWTPEQEALLGTMPDEDVARSTGHTPGAVRSRRSDRGIPTYRNRRRRG